MSEKIFVPRQRWAWATTVVLLMLAASLAFPRVRAIAVDFLGLFRVEQITVLPVNLVDLPASFSPTGPRIEQMFGDSAQHEQLGERKTAATVAEASQLAGMRVRLPSNLPDPEQLVVSPGSRISFSVDLPRVRALLQEMGRSDILLPDDLDNATVLAELPVHVVAGYGDCSSEAAASPERRVDPDDPQTYKNSNCIILAQMPSPTISAPPGLDIDQIGKAFLQILGMSAAEAELVSRNIDWATTLVLPIPANATSREVTIDGVKGTLIEEPRSHTRTPTYVLIWVKDGMLYFIQGVSDSATAFEMANSLK